MKLKMQWNAQLLSDIDLNTDPCTLNYTGRPGGLKLITKFICFLFSKHFVTRVFLQVMLTSVLSPLAALRHCSFDHAFAFSECFATSYLCAVAVAA